MIKEGRNRSGVAESEIVSFLIGMKITLKTFSGGDMSLMR
jgi:hypothetical protein